MKTFGLPTLIMLVVITLVVAGHCKTHVYSNQHITLIVRDHVVVVGAFTDGWVCFTNDDSRASCHRAIPKPTYKEIK